MTNLEDRKRSRELPKLLIGIALVVAGIVAFLFILWALFGYNSAEGDTGEDCPPHQLEQDIAAWVEEQGGEIQLVPANASTAAAFEWVCGEDGRWQPELPAP